MDSMDGSICDATHSLARDFRARERASREGSRRLRPPSRRPRERRDARGDGERGRDGNGDAEVFTRGDGENESRARAELFHTTGASSRADASSTDVVPERRSAASLRAKYGRPESSAATDAASRARETRDALVERGERLGTLQDKSARLEADAANFADLARQIRKQSERPRWF